MDVNMLIDLIGTYGFSIVACYVLWKEHSTTMKDFTKIMTENTTLLENLTLKIKGENDYENQI